MPRRRTVSLTLTTALAVGALGGTPVAQAYQPAQAQVVATAPAAGTPSVLDGTIEDLAQVGGLVVAGGTFTSTVSEDTGATVATPYAMAFDPATGKVSTTFRPAVDGRVEVVRPGPVAGTVYLGGAFKAPARGLVLVNVSDGSLVPGFAPSLPGIVKTLARVGDRLFVGGTFTTTLGATTRTGLATINATSGALDPFLTSSVAQNHNWTPTSPDTWAKAPVGVTDLDITPDGRSMVAIGNFKKVDGRDLDQMAMWDLSGSQAVLRDWRTTRLVDACFYTRSDSWVRDVDFSPDGRYFVLATVGGYSATGLCDTASRWETAASGQSVQPTWVAYTGGDSVMSIAATGPAVYAGGHQRWFNNPTLKDRAGAGAVPRPGVAALDPTTGLPLAWNPGRHPRGVGVSALMATSTGLWMGGDTETLGTGATEVTRKRLAFFPLAGGTTPSRTVPTLPGGVYSGPVPPAPTTTSVLHRVNAGGPAVMAMDRGPEWGADQGPTSAYRVDSGSTVSPTTPYSVPLAKVDSTVPLSTTPLSVFADERVDLGAKGDLKEVQWRLPVPAGKAVTVRLYFASRSAAHAAAGKRVFDVRLDGVLKADDVDVHAAVGGQTGTMRSYPITSDGSVDVQLTHEVDHPAISAIEVVATGVAATPLPSGKVVGRTFNGTTAGAAIATTSTIDANGVRGAVVIGGHVFYGKADGNLYRRTLSGQTWGAATLVDPYNDPVWSPLATGSHDKVTGADILYRGVRTTFQDDLRNVTSMFFDPATGRLYYTLYKQTGLYYRLFSPDSGTVHAQRVTVPGVVLPSDLIGAFLDRGSLYYSRSSVATLTKVGFTGSALTGTPVSIAAPPSGDWRSRTLFLGPTPS